jgi:DNA-directed RNA polymerase
MEFSRARKDPQGFITHLPIGFDGTCNGIQHLALLSRDEEAGRLVNLTDTDTPQDIYRVVTDYIMQLLEDEHSRLRSGNKKINDAWCYDWWRERLSGLSDKNKRKLFKNPTMTFPYSATSEGRGDAIVDVYKELFRLNKLTEPLDQARNFLAKAVKVACEEKLKGPVEIMKYIRRLALYRLQQDKFLEMQSVTGFPFINMYHEPNVIDIDLDSFGLRSTVADGALPETKDVKILNAASPNFIHLLDATHLMLTVLGANEEGISDILPVHDSYSCLASRATRFGKVIRARMAMLHASDPLRALRNHNVDDPNILPLPKRGNLDPLGVQKAEYAFM